jgi:hypothetical protein
VLGNAAVDVPDGGPVGRGETAVDAPDLLINLLLEGLVLPDVRPRGHGHLEQRDLLLVLRVLLEEELEGFQPDEVLRRFVEKKTLFIATPLSQLIKLKKNTTKNGDGKNRSLYIKSVYIN